MAGHGTGRHREYRHTCSAFSPQGLVPDRVDAAELWAQSANRNPVIDRTRADCEAQQLCPTRAASLPSRQPSDFLIVSAVATHVDLTTQEVGESTFVVHAPEVATRNVAGGARRVPAYAA
jgi:hypothetical protein